MKIYILTAIVLILMMSDIKGQTTTTRQFGFGAELGVMNATIDAGNFAMGFNADYRFAENFSIAEIMTFIPSADLSQVNLHTVARFNIPVGYFSLIPYMGIGVSIGKMQREGETDRAVSLAFPIGLTLVYELAENIAATGRMQYAIYDLDYGTFGTDKGYMELMFGFRFIP
jgi:hypothetical protein